MNLKTLAVLMLAILVSPKLEGVMYAVAVSVWVTIWVLSIVADGIRERALRAHLGDEAYEALKAARKWRV